MRAVLESAGGVASRVKIGSHEIVFDQASPVPGGEDRGPSPLDVMTIAVGACAHYFASAFLYGRKLPTDGLRVEVDSAKAKDPVPRVAKLLVRVVLPPGVPEHHLPAIERAVRNCPAYGTLVHPPDVELTVSRDAQAPAA